MPDDKLGRGIILVVIMLVVLGLFVAINAIRAWGPVEKAEAERLLWTPVPTPTIAPTPTLHPEVAAVKRDACKAVWICVIIGASFGLLAGVAWVGSCLARHIRATVQVEPQPKIKALPGNKPVLIGPGAIYDARFNTRARVDDANEPNVEQGQIVLGAETAKVRALADALFAIMAKQPTHRTIAERKLLEKYGEQNLLEEGGNEPTTQ